MRRYCRLALKVLLLSMGVAVVGASAQANTIYVAPGGAGDGSKWSSALGSVVDACAVALSGDEVWVSAGTYSGTHAVVPNDVGVYGGFSGGENKLSQRDPRANVTILDGAGTGTVVTLAPRNYGSQTVDGFTIQNGSLGISAETGTVLISNNVITGNSPSGGMYLSGCGGEIQNCIIHDNHRDGDGGGIRCVNSDGMVFQSNVINANTCGGSGGGVYVESSGAVLDGNLIENNVAVGYAGGVAANLCRGVQVRSNLILGNSSGAYGGGGVALASCFATVQDNRLSNNTTSWFGGGLFSFNTDIELLRNEFTANTAGANGGGAEIWGSSDGTAVVQSPTITVGNNLFQRNQAQYQAAFTIGYVGVSGYWPGTATVTGNTIIANSSPLGAQGDAVGLYAANALIANNIVAFNPCRGISSNPAFINAAGDSVSVDPSYLYRNCLYSNALYPDWGNTAGYDGALLVIPGNLLNADPRFANVDAGDFHLKNTSHCVDGGLSSLFGAGATDLDGNPRLQENAVDIGCYESQYTADGVPPVTAASLSPAPTPAGWNNTPVQVTLSAADPSPGTGVAATFYTLDGSSQQSYSGPFTVAGEGAHTVLFWSVDGWGNVESPRSVSVKIDTTPPVTTATTAGMKPVSVALSAADNLSGPAQTYYYVTGPDGVQGATKLYSPSTPISVSSIGWNTVTYWSVDAAGNAEAPHSIRFEVGIPKLQAVVLGSYTYDYAYGTQWSVAIGLSNVGSATAQQVYLDKATLSTNAGAFAYGYGRMLGAVTPGGTVNLWFVGPVDDPFYWTPGKTYKWTFTGAYGDGIPWSSTVNVTIP